MTMDTSGIDQTIQALKEECTRQMAVLSPEVPKILRRMKQIAKREHNDDLFGNAYYNEALYLYYTSDDATSYRPVIIKAARYILRSGNKKLLAELYNFIAVDAQTFGCFDVAYNYYMMSMRFSKMIGEIGACALSEANIGRLYFELEEYALARSFIRKSMRHSTKKTLKLRYLQNRMILLANDGTISVMLGDVAAAEKSSAELERLYAQADEHARSEMKLAGMFLRMLILLAQGNRRQIRKRLSEFVSLIKSEAVIQEYVGDLDVFCRELMRRKMYDTAGTILDAANDRLMSSGITYAMSVFSNLKADYYEACKDARRMNACLREQHRLSARLRMERRLLYRFSVEISALIGELQEERDRMRSENAALQIQAHTDALTGLPNRYIMNRELEAAFERAYKRRYMLGVEILDIDFFKEYNDTYGHQQGDACLRLIAGELQKLGSRPDVFCARYGGDEFVILYENMSDAEIRREAQALERAISAHNLRHKASGVSDRITVSQGICNAVPVEKNKPWDYLSVADAALYTIKKNRRKTKSAASVRFKKMKDGSGL